MRHERRRRMLMVGKTFLICAVAASLVLALISGRLGWRNYWGGFVYAPFALVVAVLFAIAVFKRRL